MSTQKIVAAVLLVVGSLSLTYGVLEWITRAAVGAPWPEKMPLVRVQPDRDLGWRMLPRDVHYTYQKRIELNSHGFRGPDITQKKAGEFRILAIGDSHVYGQGLAEGDLFTNQIEQTLNAADSNCNFRVINLGVRAYSLNQELALLRKVGLHLQPDHLILFPYINDFEEVNIRRRYEQFKNMDWYMFDISAKPEGEALLKWNLLQLLRRSAFLGWVYDRVKAWKMRGNLEELNLLGRLGDAGKTRLSVALNYLKGVHELSKSHGLAFELAVIPVAGQLIQAYPNNQYQSVFRGFADDREVAYIDLMAPLRDYYQTHNRLPVIPFDGHYNADAHQVIGQAVARHLQKSIASCGFGTSTVVSGKPESGDF